MAEKMSGKTKNVRSASKKAYNQDKRTDKERDPFKKPFKTPTETWWGKALVWIIFFGMVGLVVLTFILALIEGDA
ncbi:MAG: hypothetical protein ACLFSU_02910 [Acholeplasmataceae bacterium]